MPGVRLVFAWSVPATCLGCACKVPGVCLGRAWSLPGGRLERALSVVWFFSNVRGVRVWCLRIPSVCYVRSYFASSVLQAGIDVASLWLTAKRLSAKRKHRHVKRLSAKWLSAKRKHRQS